MEKDISQPNIVKGIPLPLIRPLPTLYYYGQYAQKNGSRQVIKLFKDNIDYLVDAIKILAAELKDNDFNSIAKQTSELNAADNNTIADRIIQIATQLSDLCIKHKEKIKDNPIFSKQNLAQLYKSKVVPLKILLIDNNNEQQRVNKLSETFRYTCYYDVDVANLHVENFIDKINKCDLMIFTSAYPISVNEDVQNVQSYHKPCLVLANLKKDTKFDQQTLRNGAWLESKGHEVLYKVFTPLRLFTTVDKTYLKFQFLS